MWAEGGREGVCVCDWEWEREREKEGTRKRERHWPNSCSYVSFPALTRWHPLQLTEYLWPGTCSPWLQAKATHWTWCAEVNLESHKTLLPKHKGLLSPPPLSLSQPSCLAVHQCFFSCCHLWPHTTAHHKYWGWSGAGGFATGMWWAPEAHVPKFCIWGLANMACARVSLSECVWVHPEMLSLLFCVCTHLRLGSYQDSMSSESIIQRNNTTV